MTAGQSRPSTLKSLPLNKLFMDTGFLPSGHNDDIVGFKLDILVESSFGNIVIVDLDHGLFTSGPADKG